MKKRLAGFDAVEDIIGAESIKIDVGKRGGGPGRRPELRDETRRRQEKF